MDRPNILFITSDQHRGDSLGCTGHPCVQTPHMDKLFHEGTCFDNAYVDCPLCIPARTTLLTGIHGHNYGCCDWAPDFRIDIPREHLLGSQLTRSGYQTELIGKTHWQLDPSDRAGFEHVLTYDALNKQVKQELSRPSAYLTGVGANEPQTDLCQLPPHLHSTDWVVDRSIEFLDNRQLNQPFFLWTSFIDPHPPFVAREPYYSMYRDADIPAPLIPEWLESDECPLWLHHHRWTFNPWLLPPEQIRRTREVYYGMITHLDAQLGRLFGYLFQNKLWENTIIIYTSDHGEQLGDYHDFHKQSFYEGSSRVPFLVRFPKKYDYPNAMHSDALIDLADVYPTLLDIAGCNIPDGLDGSSLIPVVAGKQQTHKPFLHGKSAGNHMIRTADYKYLYFIEDGRDQVFDMRGDRQELVSLTDNEALTNSLRQLLIQHLESEESDNVIDGTLVNLKRTKTTVESIQGHNALGWRH